MVMSPHWGSRIIQMFSERGMLGIPVALSCSTTVQLKPVDLQPVRRVYDDAGE